MLSLTRIVRAIFCINLDQNTQSIHHTLLLNEVTTTTEEYVEINCYNGPSCNNPVCP